MTAMTQRGIEQLERMRDDLECPQCEYALRGLPGDIVTCPECGQSINITLLLKTQWTGRWYHAPEYNTLAIPLAWSLVVAIGLVFTSVDFRDLSVHLTTWHYVLVAPGLWLGWRVSREVVRRFGDPMAIWLAMVLHVAMALYLTAALLIMREHGTFRRMFIIFTWSQWMRLGMILSLAVGLAYLGRRIERHVGGQCIRRYLRLIAES